MRIYLISVTLLSTLFLAPLSVSAQNQELPEYTIYRAGSPIVIDGRLDEPAWFAAPDVGKFQFPRYESGKQEQTVAKLLWDDEYLYVSYLCEDAHIWAEHTQRDSPVWRDDAVEVFFAPDPDRPTAYYNFEMNVIGILLDQFQPDGSGSGGSGEERWSSEGTRLKTSIVGTLNDDSDEDSHWILEIAIPFKNFTETAKNAPPEPGDVWHLNVNRLGGQTNPQSSQWSPSLPHFHVPEQFGRVTFSDEERPFWR
ncbi:MAG: carbohydrate-binding family 9-like protein [Balneolales bacterium]